MQDPITVETTVHAPLDFVWQAYTAPEHVTRWNFASPDWHCPQASADLRTGGRFTARMEAKDASMGFDFEGSYTEVIPHQRLAYTFGDRQAVVDFMPRADGVLLRIRFEAETEFPRDQQQQGWQAILNNFAAYAEAHQPGQA